MQPVLKSPRFKENSQPEGIVVSCRYLTSDLLNCLNGLARCLAYLDVDFTFKPLASLCGSRIDREREREREREGSKKEMQPG